MENSFRFQRVMRRGKQTLLWHDVREYTFVYTLESILCASGYLQFMGGSQICGWEMWISAGREWVFSWGVTFDLTLVTPPLPSSGLQGGWNGPGEWQLKPLQLRVQLQQGDPLLGLQVPPQPGPGDPGGLWGGWGLPGVQEEGHRGVAERMWGLRWAAGRRRRWRRESRAAEGPQPGRGAPGRQGAAATAGRPHCHHCGRGAQGAQAEWQHHCAHQSAPAATQDCTQDGTRRGQGGGAGPHPGGGQRGLRDPQYPRASTPHYGLGRSGEAPGWPADPAAWVTQSEPGPGAGELHLSKWILLLCPPGGPVAVWSLGPPFQLCTTILPERRWRLFSLAVKGSAAKLGCDSSVVWWGGGAPYPQEGTAHKTEPIVLKNVGCGQTLSQCVEWHFFRWRLRALL